MPSRKLPRTDDQRTFALNTANNKAASTAPGLWLITNAQYTQLQAILSPWRGARQVVADALAEQVAATTLAKSTLLLLIKNISHFIQVLNMAIDRGVLPASVRAYYDLPVSHPEVPDINTPAEAQEWAVKISTGEANRIADGGTALAWPSAAQVEAARVAAANAENAQSTKKDAYDSAQSILAAQRPAADAFIKDLWDTIEFNLRAETAASLRRRAREWGVAYEGDEEEEGPTPPPTPPTP